MLLFFFFFILLIVNFFFFAIIVHRAVTTHYSCAPIGQSVLFSHSSSFISTVPSRGPFGFLQLDDRVRPTSQPSVLSSARPIVRHPRSVCCARAPFAGACVRVRARLCVSAVYGARACVCSCRGADRLLIATQQLSSSSRQPAATAAVVVVVVVQAAAILGRVINSRRLQTLIIQAARQTAAVFR